MKLLPLDRPERIKLAADWLGREENYKWLDFGEGAQALSVISLKLMTQRDLHMLRLFTSDESDLPIGMVGLSDVRPHLKMAGSVWAVGRTDGTVDPALATAENLKDFFNGRDLSGWQGNQSLWSVEDGQIVGRTGGLKENEFLRNMPPVRITSMCVPASSAAMLMAFVITVSCAISFKARAMAVVVVPESRSTD